PLVRLPAPGGAAGAVEAVRSGHAAARPGPAEPLVRSPPGRVRAAAPALARGPPVRPRPRCRGDAERGRRPPGRRGRLAEGGAGVRREVAAGPATNGDCARPGTAEAGPGP